MQKNSELSVRSAINELYSLLEKHPDDAKSLSIFIQFLRQFLRISSADKSLPTVEIMTVLKHKKPLVFSQMRKQTNNVLFNILTHVEMDLDSAETRLKEFIR